MLNTSAQTLAQKSERILAQTRGLSGANANATQLIEELRQVVDASRQEIEHLHRCYVTMRANWETALSDRNDLERVTKERDEARREAATFYARQFYKEDAVDRMSRIYAEECGWDCFLKEDDK